MDHLETLNHLTYNSIMFFQVKCRLSLDEHILSFIGLVGGRLWFLNFSLHINGNVMCLLTTSQSTTFSRPGIRDV